jgi:hypothetical protein
MTEHNEKLRRFYSKAMPELKKMLASKEGVSRPLFLAVPDGYFRVPVRLMIVGQQTHTWGEGDNGIDELIVKYQVFYESRSYKNSPFWQASKRLFRLLNPDTTENTFIWTNLVKVDQHGKRPAWEIEEGVSGLGILQEEMRILKPMVVVFFTGPSYDNRLSQTFKGVKHRELSQGLNVLEHPDLPTRTFRTYHPAYLRRSKRWNVLEEICREVQRKG